MLNPEQRAAVNYLSGPLLVLAGAGSGKTRVITEKIAFLIEQAGYKASNIFAVTFTNKAANEMLHRINTRLERTKRRGLKISTFHTLGLDIIKKEIATIGLRPGFTIFDADDCRDLLRSFIPGGRANEREYLIQLQHLLSLWKNSLERREAMPKEAFSFISYDEAAAIFFRYEQALQAYNALDFDDLITKPLALLREYPEIRERWQNKIRYLLIDEYQDSNSSQYEFVKLLTGIRAQFTVVGDDDQSIYAWRGARPENLRLLQEDYPQLNIIKLEQNYRSTAYILRAANQLITNNKHIFSKNLWSELGLGEPLRVLCCKSEQDEAEQVIADLISHKLRFGRQFGDYAILYRGNHQSRIFEKILRQHSVSYRLSGGQSWFARAEIKDIFAYLRLLCNEADDAAFLRAISAPKRGIGEQSLRALGDYAQTQKKSLYQCMDHLALLNKLSEKPRLALEAFKRWFEDIKVRLSSKDMKQVLRELVDESGYEAYLYELSDSTDKAQKRMDGVFELLDWIDRLHQKDENSSLEKIVSKLILLDILEQEEESSSEHVQLTTIHASKGLEFNFVYLVGMEENILPHRVSIDADQIEEERRLAYVGITRAKKGLCFSLAKQRKQAGEWQTSLPSRFLDELPKECLEWYGQTLATTKEQSQEVAKNHISALKMLLS